MEKEELVNRIINDAIIYATKYKVENIEEYNSMINFWKAQLNK